MQHNQLPGDALMYRVDRNDFYKDQKNATIYTPPGVSRFLFDLVHDKIDPSGLVFDPCVGAGSLLLPFRGAGFKTRGVDIEDQGYPETQVRDFISMKQGEIDNPALVIANPPFNIDHKTQELVARSFGRRPLLPEVWLHKTIELWGGARTHNSVRAVWAPSESDGSQSSLAYVRGRTLSRDLIHRSLAERHLRRRSVSQ